MQQNLRYEDVLCFADAILFDGNRYFPQATIPLTFRLQPSPGPPIRPDELLKLRTETQILILNIAATLTPYSHELRPMNLNVTANLTLLLAIVTAFSTLALYSVTVTLSTVVAVLATNDI